MKTWTWIGPALVVTVLLAPGLQAQQERWQRVEAAYAPQAVEQIRRVVERAAELGLPPEPILDKALEGAAKGIAPGRVLQALEGQAGRLEQAGALLGPGAGRAELVAAADALRRGVPEESVRRIGAGPGDPANALVALGDLMDLGVPVGRAHDVVEAALARGARGQDLLTLRPAVHHLILQGVIPAEAAARVQQGLARGGPPGQMPAGAQGAGPGAMSPMGPPIPPGAGPPGRRRGPGGPPGGGG